MRALQQAVLSGDKHALEDLYARNRGLLYRLAQRYRGACERDRAVDLDDLIQAGYLGLVDAMHAWEPERGAWSTIAVYYIKNAMREAVGIHSTRIRAEHGALALDAPLPGSEDGTTSMELLEGPDAVVDAELLRDDLQNQVRTAVEGLKDADARQAVWACDIECKRLQRVGEQMGMTTHQLRRLRDRGRKALRKDAHMRALAKAYSLLDEQTLFYAHKGVAAFHRDMTSTTEAAALWRLERGGW